MGAAYGGASLLPGLRSQTKSVGAPHLASTIWAHANGPTDTRCACTAAQAKQSPYTNDSCVYALAQARLLVVMRKCLPDGWNAKMRQHEVASELTLAITEDGAPH